MKQQTGVKTGKEKTLLSVSRKFYDETIGRVVESMTTVGAAKEEIEDVKVYIHEYLRDGKAPERNIGDRGVLVVALLKSEIEKAVGRSAKARERSRAKREARIEALMRAFSEKFECDDDEWDDEPDEETAEQQSRPLNRRQRRLLEQQARREARKSSRRSVAGRG